MKIVLRWILVKNEILLLDLDGHVKRAFVSEKEDEQKVEVLLLWYIMDCKKPQTAIKLQD